MTETKWTYTYGEWSKAGTYTNRGFKSYGTSQNSSINKLNSAYSSYSTYVNSYEYSKQSKRVVDSSQETHYTYILYHWYPSWYEATKPYRDGNNRVGWAPNRLISDIQNEVDSGGRNYNAWEAVSDNSNHFYDSQNALYVYTGSEFIHSMWFFRAEVVTQTYTDYTWVTSQKSSSSEVIDNGDSITNVVKYVKYTIS